MEVEVIVLKKVVLGLLVGILMSLLTACIQQTGILERLELLAYNNWYFPLRGKQRPTPSIAIVAIDDLSKERLNQPWPWKRGILAQVIEVLRKDGACVIGLDFILDEEAEKPEDDIILSETIKRAGNVLLASILFPSGEIVEPIPILKEGAGGVGFINIPLDQDAFVRRVLLFHNSYPSFATALVAKYLGTGPEHLSERLPLDNKGRMLIDFVGGPDSFPTIPICYLLEGTFKKGEFKEKIVLIGATLKESRDYFPTPFYKGKMSGIEIHANTIQTILNGYTNFHYLQRVGLKTNLSVLLLLSCLCSLISIFIKPIKGLVITLLMMLGTAFSLAYIFAGYKLWLDLLPPLLVLPLCFSSVIFYRHWKEEREKVRLKRIFNRYVDAKVVDEILKEPKKVVLGGELKKVTVLFSDIRGFTTISFKSSPAEVVEMLNKYLSLMERIVFKHKGMLDKFIGDAIMSIYGAPLSKEDDAERAVRTALEMVAELERADLGFDIGIGINTGEAIVGNIGSEHRMDYTVIGDDVNLASRIEGLTKEYKAKIIISESTYNEVKDIVETEPLGEVKVKGRDEPVKIYKVKGLK